MRKSETVVREGGGRDAGKSFLITEMSAARAEKWGLRFFLALKGTDAAIPSEVSGLGIVGVAIVGLNAFLRADVDPAKLEPLLDEMLQCVKLIRDPRHPDIATPLVSDDDVEEVATILWLRSEVLRIHTGFSSADALSALISAISTSTVSSTT